MIIPQKSFAFVFAEIILKFISARRTGAIFAVTLCKAWNLENQRKPQTNRMIPEFLTFSVLRDLIFFGSRFALGGRVFKLKNGRQ